MESLPRNRDVLAGWHPFAPSRLRIMLQLTLSLGVMLATAIVVHWSLALVMGAVCAYYITDKIENLSSRAVWDARMRISAIEKRSMPEDETVSWLNRIIEVTWPIISSDYFGPFIDLFEDSLMQQVPPIVHSCRVDGLDQGTVPIRLLSFKLLHSSDEAFTGVDIDDMDESDRIFDSDLDLDESIVLEVRFSYRRPTARGRKHEHGVAHSKGAGSDDIGAEALRQGAVPYRYADKQRIQMLIYLCIGVQKLASIDFPVGVEVIGIEGTMRFRLKMSPLFPFVRDVSFTFVGKPRFELSAHPLGHHQVVDVMNLPLISHYVLSSVENVMQDFIAPKSYTVDVQGLVGDGIGPHNSSAVGLLVVVFHRAVGLASADATGKSDPFVTLSYPMAKKPMYITRVIRHTINPVWQEVAVIPVSADNIATYLRLRFSVFDADRFSADDPLGRVEIAFGGVVQRARDRVKRNRHDAAHLFETYWEHLTPARRGSRARGYLMFSIGYFERHTAEGWEHAGEVARNPALRAGEQGVDGVDTTSDKVYNMIDRIMLRLGLGVDPDIISARIERQERIRKFVSRIQAGIDVTNSPPSPHFAAGVLSFHIHSIEGLEVLSNTSSLRDTAGKSHHRLVIPHISNPDLVTSDMLPSSYVHVILNDTTVYRTRTKRSDAKPFINAGSERFIDDWKTSRIDLCVRQQRQREDDPVIGVASIPLASVFISSCRVKRWFPLVGGIGAGLISVTLLFQPFEFAIPRGILGWEVGVLEVFACRVLSLKNQPQRDMWCHFDTVSGSASSPVLTRGENGTLGWHDESFLRIAVQYRYHSFLFIELRTESRVPARSKCIAQALVHLNQIVDGERSMFRLPLFRLTDWTALEQAYLTKSCMPQSEACDLDLLAYPMPVLRDLAAQRPEDLASRIHPIGWLELDVAFMPGITTLHRSLVPGNRDLRNAYKSFLALSDFGLRPRRAQRPGEWQSVESTAPSEPELEEEPAADESTLAPTSDAKISHYGSIDNLMSSRIENIEQRRAQALGAEFEDDELKPADRRRELHRQHRGLAQFKLFRSASWIKDLSKEGAVKARRRFNAQSRALPKIESEKVSHF